MKIIKKSSLLVICLTSVIILGVSIKKKWIGTDGGYWSSIINSDGFGYYSYLPCIFIYHSFDYERYAKNIVEVRPGLHSNDILRSFPLGPNGKKMNKYPVGTSILILPFFLVAYFLSYLFGYDLNGVSYFFHISVSIAAIFYVITGLIFLRKLLKFFSISDLNISLTLLLIVLGTNLFYYAVFEPSMSHVYSFGLTCIFLYHVKRYADLHCLKNFIGMSITMCILVLIRPTNILAALFIPFICGSLPSFSGFLKHLFSKRYLILFPFLAVIVLFIQPLLWYLQTGNFFIWSYSGEGFYFNNPHILDILFSYKKGWFIYTPVMFFIILGGLFMNWFSNKFRFTSFLLFSAVIIYVLSSWWCWWYGGSFGNRAFIDFYPEFALVFAIVISNLRGYIARMLTGGIILTCMFLSLLQTDQYFNFMMSPDGMNKTRYYTIFLKRDNYFVGIYNFPDTSYYNLIPGYTFINDLKNAEVSGNNPVQQIYSVKAGKAPKENFLNLFLNISEYLPDFNNRLTFNVKILTGKGDCYFNKTLPLLGFASQKNSWSEAYSIIPLPRFKDSDDILNVSVENKISKAYVNHAVVRFAIPKSDKMLQN